MGASPTASGVDLPRDEHGLSNGLTGDGQTGEREGGGDQVKSATAIPNDGTHYMAADRITSLDRFMEIVNAENTKKVKF